MSGVPTVSALAARLDELFAPWNRADAPGLVVGVRQHGEVLYRRGFGLASIEHGVVNTPTTRMRIASISKHITASPRCCWRRRVVWNWMPASAATCPSCRRWTPSRRCGS